MKAIPAEVIAVETQGDQYHVVVRIGGARYRGSFNTFVFGKNKPFIGSCHDGRLRVMQETIQQSGSHGDVTSEDSRPEPFVIFLLKKARA
jgi:hypothetical protein